MSASVGFASPSHPLCSALLFLPLRKSVRGCLPSSLARRPFSLPSASTWLTFPSVLFVYFSVCFPAPSRSSASSFSCRENLFQSPTRCTLASTRPSQDTFSRSACARVFAFIHTLLFVRLSSICPFVASSTAALRANRVQKLGGLKTGGVDSLKPR